MSIILTGQHYIDGRWQEYGERILQSTDPVANLLLWEGMHANKEAVRHAQQSAEKAWYNWSTLEYRERKTYLENFAIEVEKKKSLLAEVISKETGKPFWESQTEVAAVIGKVKLSIQAYEERNAEMSYPNADATAALRYKSLGVVTVLGAFNFPAHLSNGHIVPALLAGNTVLYKPSEFAPAVAEVIMDCWHNSGIPAGVINCLQGDAAVGQYLLEADIKAVYFTGSHDTGKHIHRHFSERPEVMLALEMGGNNPLVIDSIDDISAGVYNTILSTMITAGQRCTAARRLLIANNAAGDAFLKAYIKACQQLRVGAYNQTPEPFMGSVISAQHAKHHLLAQQALLDDGGEALLPMRLLQENTALLSPGIVDMSHATHLQDKEIFAPLVQVFRYDHFDEAIAMANQTRYGLVAGLFSNNETNYQKFYQHIRAGLINWNRPTTGAASNLPFGGIGYSGNYRPSAYFAADYCSYPVASMENKLLTKPAQLLPGIDLG